MVAWHRCGGRAAATPELLRVHGLVSLQRRHAQPQRSALRQLGDLQYRCVSPPEALALAWREGAGLACPRAHLSGGRNDVSSALSRPPAVHVACSSQTLRGEGVRGATRLVPVPGLFHPHPELLWVRRLLCVGEGAAAQGVAWLLTVTGTRGTPAKAAWPWAFTAPSLGLVVGLSLTGVGPSPPDSSLRPPHRGFPPRGWLPFIFKLICKVSRGPGPAC